MVVLTVHDLWFEWILSLCMIFALGAVFAPLFILLGLQQGIVGNMVNRLKRNPVSRLVTPKYPIENPLREDWLLGLRNRSATVITSPTARLLLDVEGLSDPVNAVPTVPSDPLLVENGISLPESGGRPIVISDRLSKETRKNLGDTLQIILVRNIGGTKREPIVFRVAGVLPPSAGLAPKIWLPKTFFNWFFQWRRGHAVPEIGLSGTGAVLTPEYDGILTLLESVPSSEEYRRMLAGEIGFSEAPRPASDPDWTISPDLALRLWKPRNNRVFPSNFPPLIHRHHELGYAVETVPYLSDFLVRLRSGDHSVELSLTILPEGSEPNAGVSEGAVTIYAAPSDGFSDGATGELSIASGPSDRSVQIPVRITIAPTLHPGQLAANREFAGKMNAARRQAAVYDPASQEFRPLTDGDRFFRAYAESIDTLESLVTYVRSEGDRRGEVALKEPISRLDEVHNIQRLAGYMETLYLMIVGVAGVSGFFAIFASVYAGVQRRRRDIAYLQLLGVHQGALFLFPYLKSLALILGGIGLALSAYGLFGNAADHFFAEALVGTDSLTRLGPVHIMLLVVGIIGTGTVASLLAALAIMRIEPGEFIRE